MTNKESIIKGLESLHERLLDAAKQNVIATLDAHMVADALALLKEQEPKQIVRKQGKRENSDGSIEFFAEWHCPHCGMLLNRGFATPWLKFCYNCGKGLVWDE